MSWAIKVVEGSLWYNGLDIVYLVSDEPFKHEREFDSPEEIFFFFTEFRLANQKIRIFLFFIFLFFSSDNF